MKDTNCKLLLVVACENEFYLVLFDLHLHVNKLLVYAITWEIGGLYSTLAKPRQARHYQREELQKELKYCCPSKEMQKCKMTLIVNEINEIKTLSLILMEEMKSLNS